MLIDLTGAEAHGKRTATFCREIASREGFASSLVSALTDAAICAARPQSPGSEPRPHSSTLSDRLTAAALDNRSDVAGCESELVEILRTAKKFDQMCMSDDAGAKRSLAQVVHDGRADVFIDPVVGFVVTTVHGVSREQVVQLTPKLPVFPAVASRALRLLEDRTASLASIEALIASDPVLAGAVVAEANKVGRMGVLRRIGCIGDAVRCLGTAATAQIVVAESLKPLLTVGGQAEAWAHAVQVAKLAQTLAARVPGIHPTEAYLAGLVHDCGKLLLSIADPEAQKLNQRLVDGACPTTVAELLAFDLSHAEAGAEVLNFWSFPAEHVEAIRWHHEPERTNSKLAALLYVLEHWTSPREQFPASERLATALRSLGMTVEQVEQQVGPVSNT